MRSQPRRIGTIEADARPNEAEASHAVEAAEDRVERLGADLHEMQVLADARSCRWLPTRELRPDDRHRYFKRVNDLYGHAAGDEVVRQVGRIISDAIRTTDKVARFGSEEFAVLLGETDLKGAAIFADRIRQTVASTVFTPDGPCLRATTCIGMAEAEFTDGNVDHTIED